MEKTFEHDFGSLEYWVPDADLWQAYIQNHKEERKEEWKKVAPILKQLFKNESYQGKSYLKFHKAFFFSGIIPKEYLTILKEDIRSGGDEFIHSFLYFYFWYHPQLTEEVVFDRLALHQEAYEFRMRLGRYTQGKEKELSSFLNGYMHTRLYDSLIEWPKKVKSFTDFGMLGEEKADLLLKVLLFGNGVRIKDGFLNSIHLNADELLRIILRSGAFISKGKINDEYKHNPRSVGIRLWPLLSHEIERLQDETTLHQYAEPLNSMIFEFLSYNPRGEASSDLMTQQVKMIKNQYEEGLFADWLNQIFEKQIEEMG